MGTYSSADVGFLLCGGYSLLGSVTEINDGVEAPLQEKHVLGDGWFKYGWPGIRKAHLTQSGFYDDAAGQVNAALVGSLGVSRVFAWCPEKNLLGAHFIGYEGALETKYDRIVNLGQYHKAAASYTPSGNVDRGRVLHIHEAETGPDTGTAVNDGASSAVGGAGYLEVSALTLAGYTSAQVIIEHSASGSGGWTTLVSFTVVTAAPTAQRVAVASGSTINQYLRSSLSFVGSGGSPSITFMSGFARF